MTLDDESDSGFPLKTKPFNYHSCLSDLLSTDIRDCISSNELPLTVTSHFTVKEWVDHPAWFG